MSQDNATAATEQASVLEQLSKSAGDALTDEMVGRLSETISSGMTLLDEFNRLGLVKVLPVLSQMIESGDMERVLHLARLVGAAQDAVTEEMAGRLAEAVSGGLTLLDKANRGHLDRAINLIGGSVSRLTPPMEDRVANALSRLLQLVDRLEQQHVLEDVLQSIEETSQDPAVRTPVTGFRGLWTLMKQGEFQAALQFVTLFTKRLRSAREKRSGNK